ncbi:transporter substrate-binding domain-containing protein [Pseudoalteromonas sp. H105]|uniref:transporter substrate-binding domain-containing protein n=1 Tax=Pseudoalteromonas sp. H105 TaxID=1348393 RepID=UPI000731F8D2|nr:transporter substrate-binding domain-containing protein [Pseudoalteromonas sp. H105]KTF16589.1 hypothetical protein ATS75_03805 [Pseudoalteromonas sp. H105]
MKYLLLAISLIFFHLSVSAKQRVLLLSDDENDRQQLLSLQPVSLATDTLNLVLNQLTDEFDFDVQSAPISRIEPLLNRHTNACVVNRVKTPERQAHYLFSLPIHMFPNHRLYYDASWVKINAKQLNEQGKLLSLQTLFTAKSDHKLLLVKDKSYGDYLDSQLALLNKNNTQYRSGGDYYAALVAMLERHRSEYALMFPATFFEQTRQKVQNEQLRSVAIAGNPTYILGHIACKQSDITTTFIAKVNHVLKQLYNDERLYQAHIRYLSEADKTHFKQDYRNVLQCSDNAATPCQ